MATPIKRIEKDFFLRALYDEQIPVVYIKGQTQHSLMVEKTEKDELCFKLARNMGELNIGDKLDLIFDFRGQIITFPALITSITERHIFTSQPEFLYKNLDRSFSRVSAPPDLHVQFNFTDDRYSLSYPKINEFEREEEGDFLNSLDPSNLTELINQMEVFISGFATGYKMVIFKDVKPSSTEERVLAETGRAIFIPSTKGNLPVEDPFPKKRLVTEEIFKQFLKNSGIEQHSIDDISAKFIQHKLESGIVSDLWVPILFQEYVVGYIRAWIGDDEMRPFDYEEIESLYQFAKILAYSLKINNYFEAGKIQLDPFEGRIIDISASGLLFSYPVSEISDSLLFDTELSVDLNTPQRTVKTKIRIVRKFNDKFREYFGCIFVNMQPEDLRFLFEYIYGKPFTDKDAAFLAGQV